jgi:hypothetical protein
MEGLAHALEDASPFVFQTACELVRMAGACGSWTQDTRRLVGLAKALGAAPLEAQDVDGLGRLDHSTVIPRKKIGLGIIPRPNPGASGLEENSFKLEAASFVEAQKTSESAFLAQSVYETTSIPQVSHQPEARPAAPRRTQEKPPIQPLDSPPSPTLPATVVPESRTKEILRWIGLGVLCVAAVLLGRYLKTLIG